MVWVKVLKDEQSQKTVAYLKILQYLKLTGLELQRMTPMARKQSIRVELTTPFFPKFEAVTFRSGRSKLDR